jgi:hypothetical protein
LHLLQENPHVNNAAKEFQGIDMETCTGGVKGLGFI